MSSPPVSFSEPLVIGTVPVPGRVVLAPMAGITDVPMRRIAHETGTPLTVSEMVAGRQLVAAEAEAVVKAERVAGALHAVQLAGCEPAAMAEATRIVVGSGADLVDINMGCPAKRVVNGWSGSALMRDLEGALAIVSAVVKASPVPVTLKMRLGWDEASRNAPELARRAEAEGVALVTVHGRTRSQFYTGRADWAEIARVREAVRIPLVANGDCDGVEAARTMLRVSGADAVMIGRAAVGRPWLPGLVARALSVGGTPARPGMARRLALLEAQVAEMVARDGAGLGLRLARKHVAATFDAVVEDGLGMEPADLRRRALTATDVAAAAEARAAWFDAVAGQRSAA
ncbi:tRNA dihydrouridine synthase DusB [Segnochrobactraceae bacterium EtOH-i3]